jgi:hypothetical protein
MSISDETKGRIDLPFLVGRRMVTTERLVNSPSSRLLLKTDWSKWQFHLTALQKVPHRLPFTFAFALA